MSVLHAGLDVADSTTAICVVDAGGQIVEEVETDTTPESISSVLAKYRRSLKSVGQESGNKSAWLHKALTQKKYPMFCLDARWAHSALGARTNKTDKNDAYGLALHLARGIYTLAYVKSEDAIQLRMALGLRSTLILKSRDLKFALDAGRKRLDGGKPRSKKSQTHSANGSGAVLASTFASAERSMEVLTTEVRLLQREMERAAKVDPICCRLMTIPGVGPITALTYRAAVDDPRRFKESRDVAAYFGLTPRTRQSGPSSWTVGISRAGDRSTRGALYAAASVLINNSRINFRLRRWGRRLAAKRGHRYAAVAVARKLAVLMHHLWVSGEDFDPAR